MSQRGSGDEMDDRKRSNRSLLKRLVAVVVVMFGFGFAMIPFYNKICEVTGLRNIDVSRRRGQHPGRCRAHACASSSTAT